MFEKSSQNLVAQVLVSFFSGQLPKAYHWNWKITTRHLTLGLLFAPILLLRGCHFTS